MVRIHSTTAELIPVASLERMGLHLENETCPSRFGYPIGVDIWECLWYELVNTCRLGADWRKRNAA